MARDIVITLPKEIEWADYQKELDAVADGHDVIRYQVSQYPDPSVRGGRCYLVWRGFVRGWMKITGLVSASFVCETSGKKWGPGKFIERSGKFQKLEELIPMRGFQGFRYWQTPLNPPASRGESA